MDRLAIAALAATARRVKSFFEGVEFLYRLGKALGSGE